MPALACSCTGSTRCSGTTTTRSGAETPNELPERLAKLEVGESLFADIAYVPWVIRARDMLGVQLPGRSSDWLAALEQRPSVAAEVQVVRSL